MNINFIQIIGLVLFGVGMVKLLYLYAVKRKGYKTTGRLVGENKKEKNKLTNYPKVEFTDQKKAKRVMPLKVSKSFVEVHAKENSIDIIYYEGRIFHPNEVYSAMIVPAIGLALLLLGGYY